MESQEQTQTSDSKCSSSGLVYGEYDLERRKSFKLSSTFESASNWEMD